MQEQILQTMKTFMSEITQIKEVFDYPLQGNPSKYPAMVFYVIDWENQFNTQKDNFIIERYNVSIILNATGTTIKKLCNTDMPKLTDKIRSELAENWDYGTIDGHRVWARAVSGSQEVTNEQAGVTVSLNIILEVKYLADI